MPKRAGIAILMLAFLAPSAAARTARAQVLIPRAALIAQATPTRHCWIDVKTGKPVRTSFKGSGYEQEPDGSWINPRTGEKVATSPVGSDVSVDGKTAFNPTTGQNYARGLCPQQTARTYCWIDVKTGKPVRTSFKGSGYEQEPDGSWINPRTGEKVATSPVGSELSADGKTAFNPATGQNFARELCPRPKAQTARRQRRHRSGTSPLAGGNLHRIYYYVQGTITSRDGCKGEFYSAAPKVGGTTNEAGDMWLSGGVLHATGSDTPYNNYVGRLSSDGSFTMRAESNGVAATIQGRIASDGAITGTYVWPFMKGCIDHVKLTKGSHLDASWTALGGRK